MEVTLRQLRAFAALVRTGGFTRAAESLHVTQSALSGLIKELESQLGVRLVDRSTRSIKLSDIGAEFHEVTLRILHDLDTALDDIDNLKRLRKGVVRMAAPQLMSSTLIPEVIASFKETHPDIQLNLQDCAVDSAIAKVTAGSVDFSIGPDRQDVTELSSRPLFDLPFMAIFPKGHPLESKANIKWEHIVKYPIIALQGPFTDRLEMDLYKSIPTLKIQPAHEVTFMSTALSMVSAGLGITVGLPYTSKLVDIYGLVMRPLGTPTVNRQFLIYQRENSSLPPAAETFVKHLFEQVSIRGWRDAELGLSKD